MKFIGFFLLLSGFIGLAHGRQCYDAKYKFSSCIAVISLAASSLITTYLTFPTLMIPTLLLHEIKS